MNATTRIASGGNTIEAALKRLQAHGPVTAIALTGPLGLERLMGRETIRRRVREVIAYARNILGIQICADGSGYWLARSTSEWRAYQDATKNRARFVFVRAAKQQSRARDRRSGQLELFDMRPFPTW